MNNDIYIANTYLKVLTHSDNALLESLLNALGPNAKEILKNDYLQAVDIDPCV